KAGARQKMLETVVQEEGTLIILESPHRLLVSLKDMLTVLGDRRIAVARELTKIHEEVFRGRLSQAIEHFTSPKGEFTLVVAGRQEEEIPSLDTESRRRLGKLKLSGVKAREAVAQLARETGLPRRELYRAWLKSAKEGKVVR
ncbi:MAG: 16S rRNA (cytidine(1402)-2'-O)-methyltransferase, partial [Chloroflexota bacterium]